MFKIIYIKKHRSNFKFLKKSHRFYNETMLNKFNAALSEELSLFECGKEECRVDKKIVNTAKPYHLFHYILEGKGYFELDGVRYKLSKDTIFYIPNGVSAKYYPDPNDPWVYEWLGFNGTIINKIFENINLSSKNPIILCNNHDFRKYFNSIYLRYAVKGQLDLKCLGMMYELLSTFIDELGQENENASSKKVLVLLAQEFINNNYQFQIKITDVAKNVHVTPNYLANAFKDILNISAKGYLTKVRMEKASALLLSSSYSIQQVGLLVGYKNQLHFSGEFKKYYGVSPKDYKKGLIK